MRLVFLVIKEKGNAGEMNAAMAIPFDLMPLVTSD